MKREHSNVLNNFTLFPQLAVKTSHISSCKLGATIFLAIFLLGQMIVTHYKKTVLRPRFKNAAIGHKNAALRPFGLRPHFLRPHFILRPKTCDYRPGRSKAAHFEPRPKTRSYSRGKNAA